MTFIVAKGKYHDWLTPDGLLLLEGWAREGLNDEQIAAKVGIRPSTYYEWANRFPEFAEAIKKGKAPVDIQVENALFKRAIGYDYEETVTEVYGDGKKHVRKVKKHMPPDVGAIAFWLKNRKPEKWRDKPAAIQQDAEQNDGFLEALSGTAAQDWTDDDE